MKNQFLIPVLALGLVLTLNLLSHKAHAAPGGPDSLNKHPASACVMEARLEYRFFQDRNRPNRYTLALEHTPSEPAIVRILAENGAQLYSARVDNATLVRHFDLRRMERGKYTLQIAFGNQMREERIRVR